MASSEVVSALKQLESSPDPAGYNDLLSKILSSSGSDDTLSANLIAYVKSILADALGIIISRPLLSSFVTQFGNVSSPHVKIEVGQSALALIQPKVISFDEQDSQLKFILADAFEANEDYVGSAKILQQINLDGSQRNISADDRARVWVRIVRCYLEEDDPTSATGYLNRIKPVLHDVTQAVTRLEFQLSQARILDSQRQFLEASTAYHTISSVPTIDESERLYTLSQAMICAVLAPAGPQRGRTLARLYKDDRANQVEEFSILEKIFLDRLLSPEEVKAFASRLKPHHLAKTSDGSTVLDKAVLEHNLLGASRLYANISIDALGELLGVDSDKAEQYAAQMIGEGRVAGYIDQIDRYIFFEGEGSGQRKVGMKERVVGMELRRWDEGVKGLAEDVERVATMIQVQHPEFYAQHMVH
ncbi:COP9 signalosome-like protein complex subunit 4 [Rhizodiscina lignyota]|uniref:COP9 signalosome complex subunit 4 n=1 Tax=Rhizodiscina lignyota TaxID=1504668 RepID=A0A9P4M3B7_9PEZI|nr:COP9 signalosome-like protein complex subunit 4 [Rhizodiscina lignyota]